MKYLSVLFLISFVAVAIFGYAGLSHHGGFSLCASSLLPQSMPCSEDSGMAVAHANIYHAFSLATISLLLLLALSFIIAIFYKLVDKVALPATIEIPFVNQAKLFSSYQKQTHWFTLLEKRDPNHN